MAVVIQDFTGVTADYLSASTAHSGGDLSFNVYGNPNGAVAKVLRQVGAAFLPVPGLDNVGVQSVALIGDMPSGNYKLEVVDIDNESANFTAEMVTT